MARTLTVTPGTPSGLSWDGAPLEVWGVRVASTAAKDAWTEQPLAHLDEYLRYGVNALTVFYQGSSGAQPAGLLAGRPRNRAGRAAPHGAPAARLRRAPHARGRRSSSTRIRSAASTREPPWLEPRRLPAGRRGRRPRPAPYPNVIVNICQRAQRAQRSRTAPSRCARRRGSSSSAAPRKAGDPDRLVGGGGGHGAARRGGRGSTSARRPPRGGRAALGLGQPLAPGRRRLPPGRRGQADR